MTGAPSPAEMDAVIVSGRRSHRAAPHRVRRRELRLPSLVPVAGEHHRSPEMAGKPPGSGEKQVARFLKHTCSSPLSD